jgi:transcription antitermination factor NusG
VENIQERWFIILTEPQRERTAAAGLIARRFSAFAPEVIKSRPKMRNRQHVKDANGRKVIEKIASPMFPGYIFVRFPVGAEQFEAARKVPGVTKFMQKPGVGDRAYMSGDDKATLPASLIAGIQAEEARQLSAFEEAQKSGADKLKIPFVVNGPARIEGGPYDDIIGKMVKMTKAGRITLLLSMLGGEVPVTVDGSQVRAA